MTPQEQALYEQSYDGQGELLKKRVLALVAALPWPLRPLARAWLKWSQR